MKIPKNMIIISAILCSINFVYAQKIITAPYVIENNRHTTVHCRSVDTNDTKCSFIVETYKFGYTYNDVCSLSLPIDFDDMYRRMLHPLGSYVIYSSQKITDDTAIIYVRFIDMNKCIIKLSVDHKLTSIAKISDLDHKIIPFEDDTFDILYIDSLNLNSSGKVTYDFNGTRIGDNLNLYKNFSGKLKEYEAEYRRLYEPSYGFNDNWAPISAVDGFFHLIAYGNESIISTITRDLRIKNIKTLLADSILTESLDTLAKMSFGYEHLAVYIRDNDNKALRCYLLDKDLNIVFDVNLNLGYDVNHVQLYVIAPKEVLLLVNENIDNGPIINMRIFKINQNGKVGKALVMPNMKIISHYKDFRIRSGYYANLNTMNESYCFTFYTVEEIYKLPVNNTECIDKQALDNY